jgi:hypothetical protein
VVTAGRCPARLSTTGRIFLMKLHDATPDRVHFGTAEASEMARLLTEPHVVLREAGLNITADAVPGPIVVVPPSSGAAPTTIVVGPRIGTDGRVEWVALLIVDGDILEEFKPPNPEK